MSRPSSKEKDLVSLAIVSLRKFLGDSQQEFATRLGTSQPVVGRYETNYTPGEKVLRQLYELAVKAGHEQSASVFKGALDMAETGRRAALRAEHMMSPVNLRAANDVLISQWNTLSSVGPNSTKAELLKIIKQVRRDSLKMADLIMFYGRQELRGEIGMLTRIYTDAEGRMTGVEIEGEWKVVNKK
jgi:transcriptional regulator with XRE-family HTH domain